MALGVSGYKLDECDNSDFTGNWSFPELSSFPSGADGEQMHCLFGRLYQDTIQSIFDEKNTRTYGLVRSSHALAAPYPYVLYSDLYDHSEFVKAVAKMGLSGLLWTPELRDASSAEDLIRRLQAAVMSPMALINAWYIRNPPWMQIHREANNRGELDPNREDLERRCRDILQLRMRFVPYLHAAFARYHLHGLPPFRPLVMDHPDDRQTWPIDSQYMMGESVMVAPVIAGHSQREIYLPDGEWVDYWTNRHLTGKQRIQADVPLEQIPIFVRAGTILPLADAAPHTADPACSRITAIVYGDSPTMKTSLFEEDGFAKPQLTEVELHWDGAAKNGSVRRNGPARAPRYEITGWRQIPRTA